MKMTKTIVQLMEFFQECKRRGESAQLFLETRNSLQFATFWFNSRNFHHTTILPIPILHLHTKPVSGSSKKRLVFVAPAATPLSPQTARCTDTTESRRIATPSRRLGTSGAGSERNGTSWQPATAVEVTMSLIVQLDGAYSRGEKDDEDKLNVIEEPDCKNELFFTRQTDEFSCDDCNGLNGMTSFACVHDPCNHKICEDCYVELNFSCENPSSNYEDHNCQTLKSDVQWNCFLTYVTT